MAFWLIAVLALFMQGKIPYMLYLSVISIVLAVQLLIFKYKLVVLRNETWNFFKNSWPFMLIFVPYIIPGFFYINEYSLILKEIIYGLYVFFLVFILFLDNQIASVKFNLSTNFSKGFLIFISVLLISFLWGIYKTGEWRAVSFGVKTDYNYLAFNYLAAFIIVVFLTADVKRFWIKVLATILLFAVSVPTLFSGSRRGVLIFGLLHLGYILYALILFYRKKNHKVLTFYFSVLTGIFLLLSVLFSTNSKTLRLYFVDTYLDEKADVIKSEYTSVFLRYLLVFDKTATYKELYDKHWNIQNFVGGGFFENIVLQTGKKQLNNLLTQKEYDKAFERIKTIALFSASKEEFILTLPKPYKIIADTIDLNAVNFEKIPYILPIPYVEKDFLVIKQIENLFLINEPKKNKSDLKFIKSDTLSSHPKISSVLLLFPDTEAAITFRYAGVNKNDLRIKFPEIIKHGGGTVSEYDTALKGGVFEKTIKINTKNIKGGLYSWQIVPNIQLNDTFTISSVNYSRFPVTDEYFFIDNDVASAYYSAKKRRAKLNRGLFEQFLMKSTSLTQQENDSFKLFVKNIDLLKFEFQPYGQFSTPKKVDGAKSWRFECIENNIYTRAFVRIPVFSGSDNRLTLKVKSKQVPSIYIKRFPELESQYLVTNYQEAAVRSISDSLYHINFRFNVKESSSAVAALVVGLENAKKGETFEIFDVGFDIIKLPDTIATEYQYEKLRPYINKVMGTIYLSSAPEIAKNFLNNRDISNHSSMFTESRTERWYFAWIYFNNLKWYQQFFGNGFDYLELFQHLFSPKKNVKYDYPHNPIISTFLYSGILGGLLYIYFIVLVFYRYWKLREQLPLFGLLFILVFSFSMFSGNSHFSVPAFIFLSLIPFAFKMQKKKQSVI